MEEHKNTSNRFPHDPCYKELFSSPSMIKSLILDFVSEDFVHDFNFDSLQLCSGNYITEDFHERKNDIIWRLLWKGRWCYVYLMLEFQSTQHHWMALRMLSYTALLWETLIKTDSINSGGKLPPVFPIVLYNGDTIWKQPLELSELISYSPTAINSYQPSHKYYVIDVKRIPQKLLINAKGDAAYMVRVEQANSSIEIFKIAIDFEKMSIPRVDNNFQTSMLEWMDKKIRQIDPTWCSDSEGISKEEVMLAELIAKYKQPYVEEGFSLGKAEGYSDGYSVGETGGMHCIIKDILADKFGKISDSWDAAVSRIKDPAILRKLSVSISHISSPEDVDVLLRKYGTNG